MRDRRDLALALPHRVIGGGVESLIAKLVWITAENFFLAGSFAFFFFKAKHDGNILITMQAICDEERDDDVIRRLRELVSF